MSSPGAFALARARRSPDPPAVVARAQLKPAIVLFGLSFVLFVITGGGEPRTIDEWVLLEQTESLFERGEIAIPQAVARGHFYGRIGADGAAYGAYPPAWAVAALPSYALARAIGAVLGLDPNARLALGAWGASLTNAAASAAVVVLLALVALRLFRFDPARTFAIAPLLALATPLWAYAGSLYTEPLAAAAFLAATSGVTAVHDRARAAHVVGASLAAAILLKVAHAVAVPVFVLAAVLAATPRARVPTALSVIAWSTAAIGVHLCLQAVLFGDPLQTAYPSAAAGKALNTFRTPLARGLFGLTLSPGKGLLFFAPLALLGALRATRALAGRPHLVLLLLAAPLTFLFFYAPYTQWEGGYCFGPRYLVPVLPLLLLPLFPLLLDQRSRWLRRATWVVACASLWIQLVGASTDWFAAASDRATYYDAHLDYRLDYAPQWMLSHRFVQGLAALAQGDVPAARSHLNLSALNLPARLR